MRRGLAVSVPSASYAMGPKENITLHVPEQSIEAYKSAWPGFKAYAPISDPGASKCATPTIKVVNGVLKFECATEGVKFHETISSFNPSPDSYDKDYSSTYNGVVLPNITISVYATKSGYNASDVATKVYTISDDSGGLRGDLNNDGVVNVADHVELSNIILEQN